jgi:hypothetical protein
MCVCVLLSSRTTQSLSQNYIGVISKLECLPSERDRYNTIYCFSGAKGEQKYVMKEMIMGRKG